MTLVCPGYVATGMIDGAPAGSAASLLQISSDEAARKIARAVHRRRRELVLPFHAKVAVWMQRHVPAVAYGLLSWRASRSP